MKPWMLVTFVLMCLACTEGPLPEELPAEKEACFKVSYVDGICGHMVLKIEDARFAALGETWNGHTPVFYTFAPCQAPADLLTRDFFFVRLIENENTGDCAYCLAYFSYTGTKRYHIEFVEACAQQPVR
jgi:hypothetical protein